MAKGNDAGVKVVLIAAAGLTLTISADAMAQLRDAAPGRALEIFRQAVFEGKVDLLSPVHAAKQPDQKLDDFSDTFNQRWNDMGGRT